MSLFHPFFRSFHTISRSFHMISGHSTRYFGYSTRYLGFLARYPGICTRFPGTPIPDIAPPALSSPVREGKRCIHFSNHSILKKPTLKTDLFQPQQRRPAKNEETENAEVCIFGIKPEPIGSAQSYNTAFGRIPDTGMRYGTARESRYR